MSLRLGYYQEMQIFSGIIGYTVACFWRYMNGLVSRNRKNFARYLKRCCAGKNIKYLLCMMMKMQLLSRSRRHTFLYYT